MAERQVQKYHIVGQADANTSDGAPVSQPLGFRQLVNCYGDMRLGALVKRNGSTTESITSSLGTCLGIGEFYNDTTGSLTPTESILLAMFSNSSGTFYELDSGTWGAISKDSNTSFTVTRPPSFARLGGKLFIAGGRPARWDGSGNIYRVGIPKPSSFSVASSATGITGTFQYAITFYNNTDGYESDLSDAQSVTVSNKQVDLSSIPTSGNAAGITHVRIYRTITNSDIFRYVGQVTLGTTTYADTTADADLGAIFGGETGTGQQGYYGEPPSSSFLVAAFQKRLWWVDSTNPRVIKYSRPYTGSDVDLDYYPEDHVMYSDEPITAMHVMPNRLVLFHPRSISYVSGFDTTDFVIAPLVRGVGTLFPASISSDGDDIIFLAERGFVSLNNATDPRTLPGNQVISRPIQDELNDIMKENYSDHVYCAGAWSDSLRQFIFILSAQSASSGWEDSTTGLAATWVDSDTGAVVNWTKSGGGTATNRIKVWGYSPETQFWTEYRFAQAVDGNTDGAYISSILIPSPSSDTLDMQQDKIYFGFHDGTEGGVFAGNDTTKAQDDNTSVTASWLTKKIQPHESGFAKYRSLAFNDTYADPFSQGTLQYIRNIEDPEKQGFSGNLEEFTEWGDHRNFDVQKARFIHLYGTDSSNDKGRVLLSNFELHFHPSETRTER